MVISIVKISIWILESIWKIIQNEIWRYFLAVFFGGLLTFGTLLIVDWIRARNKIINWKTNLLIEVEHNMWKKLSELDYIYGNIQMPIIVVSDKLIKVFDCNFDVFHSLMTEGINLKNKNLMHKYSEFIIFERSAFISKNKYLEEAKNLKGDRLIVYYRYDILSKIIKQCEDQFVKIYKIYKRLKSELPE